MVIMHARNSLRVSRYVYRSPRRSQLAEARGSLRPSSVVTTKGDDRVLETSSRAIPSPLRGISDKTGPRLMTEDAYTRPGS